MSEYPLSVDQLPSYNEFVQTTQVLNEKENDFSLKTNRSDSTVHWKALITCLFPPLSLLNELNGKKNVEKEKLDDPIKELLVQHHRKLREMQKNISFQYTTRQILHRHDQRFRKRKTNKSTKEWNKTIEMYEEEKFEQIGCGGESFTYRCVTVPNVVVKVFRGVDILKPSTAKFLSLIDHDNVMKYFNVCCNPPTIFMKYCECGSLRSIIDNPAYELGPYLVQMWSLEILNGLEYLNSKLNLVHCDLKPDNLLVDENGTIRISDIATAQRENTDCSSASLTYTPSYAAPEILQSGILTLKTDIWSFGIVYYELLLREQPYKNMENPAITYASGKGKLRLIIPQSLYEVMKDIIRNCQNIPPKCRPTVRQLTDSIILMKIDDVDLTSNREHEFMREIWRAEISETITKRSTMKKKKKLDLKNYQKSNNDDRTIDSFLTNATSDYYDKIFMDESNIEQNEKNNNKNNDSDGKYSEEEEEENDANHLSKSAEYPRSTSFMINNRKHSQA